MCTSTPVTGEWSNSDIAYPLRQAPASATPGKPAPRVRRRGFLKGDSSMPGAVTVDPVRTPIGRAVKGSLKDVRADDLAAVPLQALQERKPEVNFSETGDVMMGAAFGAGEQGYNSGRNASLLAGIDHHVPACTLNRFCASSLQTIRMAFHAIRAGEGEQYVAAGVESVSHAGGGAPVPYHPKLDGSEGSLYDVYIPMGIHQRKARR